MAKTLDEAGVKRLIQEIKGANKNLNAPIPISTENTTESKAQNVKNIADYVKKAKAAGIADVNGMAVTCFVNGNYSGAGYLYGEDIICGITTYDDLVTPYNFAVLSDGLYTDNPFIVKGTTGQVTSDMLDKGARRPIILTPSTTEVDEETYQKLLSDDVDVVFKDETGNPLYLNFKESSGNDISLWFGYIVTGPISAEFPYGYSVIVQIIVTISSATPHKLVLSEPSEVAYKPDEFIDKSTLSPVLQEIDLRGTDAERKAKLDQFETDWKALTGASDLIGARFVGFVDVESGLEVIFSYNASNGYWSGLNKFADGVTSVTISPLDGSLTITPLFSHLEAITIYTDNTPEHMQANLDNIAAYEANLQALGVDVTKGYMIHVTASGRNGFLSTRSGNYPYAGYVSADSSVNEFYNILILGNGEYYDSKIQSVASDELHTISKLIVPAINEVNALAKGYSTLLAPIELTTETAQNKTAIDARVAAFTAQGISLTNGCCIPVTYKGVYAGNISLINGDWYGLLVKNTNNPADNINIKLSADGTITEGNSAQ